MPCLLFVGNTATGIKKVDPASIEPARLPFELHTTSLALVNQQQKRDQRALRHANAMNEAVARIKADQNEEEDDGDTFWETDVAAAEKAKVLAQQNQIEMIQKSKLFLTVSQTNEKKEEEEYDRLKREEISAYWFNSNYHARPTSQWCDIQLTVPKGQESAGGRVTDADLGNVFLCLFLEVTFF